MDRACEECDVGEQVKNMPEDGERLGIMADVRRSAGRDAVMLVTVKELESARVGLESDGVVEPALTGIPSFEEILSCHVERNAPLPQIVFEEAGSDGVGPFDSDQGKTAGTFGRRALWHRREGGAEGDSEFGDGAIVKPYRQVGQVAGLFGGGFTPAVKAAIDDERRTVGRMAGQRRQIIITMSFSFLRLDADRGEEVNQVDAVELLRRELFHTSQFSSSHGEGRTMWEGFQHLAVYCIGGVCGYRLFLSRRKLFM